MVITRVEEEEVIRIFMDKKGNKVRFSTTSKRVTRSKMKEQAERLRQIQEENMERANLNNEAIEKESSGLTQALVELTEGSDSKGRVEVHMGEVGPATTNILGDSRHAIKEVSEEEAKLLSVSLDEEEESEGGQEGDKEEEGDMIEDSDGEEDGWDKIEFA